MLISMYAKTLQGVTIFKIWKYYKKITCKIHTLIIDSTLTGNLQRALAKGNNPCKICVILESDEE